MTNVFGNLTIESAEFVEYSGPHARKRVKPISRFSFRILSCVKREEVLFERSEVKSPGWDGQIVAPGFKPGNKWRLSYKSCKDDTNRAYINPFTYFQNRFDKGTQSVRWAFRRRASERVYNLWIRAIRELRSRSLYSDIT